MSTSFFNINIWADEVIASSAQELAYIDVKVTCVVLCYKLSLLKS